MLEGRQLMSADFDLGLNINDASTDVMNKAIPVMKELGVKSVRIWASVTDFNRRKIEGSLKRAIDYKNAGFDVMLIVNPPGGIVPDPGTVKGWFAWASSEPSLKKAVDRWQVGNEVDHNDYWKGSLGSYVSGLLKPAYEALRANNEPVVSASVSWNPKDVKTMIDAGMLNYTDYVGFHPYSTSVTLQKQRIDELKGYVAGRKPLVASEWNIRGFENNPTKWAEAAQAAMPQVSESFNINYYFALINTTKTPAGPGGIMNYDGTKTPFFYAIQNGMKKVGDAKGGLSTPTLGATPQPVLPSISKVSLVDATTRKVLVDSLADGAVFDARSLGSGKLMIIATVNDTSSVRFTVDGKSRMENAYPFSAFGDNTGAVFTAGQHAISVQAFSQGNAKGIAGQQQNIRFTILSSTGTASTTPTALNAGQITKFSLHDSNTGKLVPGYADLNEGDVVDLDKLGINGVTIAATTAGATESVQFDLNGVRHVDNDGPYQLFQRVANGNYQAVVLAGGSYRISATPFAQDNAAGAKGATRLMNFTILARKDTSRPQVTALQLVDSRTGVAIRGYEYITADQTIKLSTLTTRNIAVVALTNGRAKCVRFSGPIGTRVENVAPYAVFGDNDGKFANWIPATGSYKFEATAYAESGAKGAQSDVLSLTMKFV